MIHILAGMGYSLFVKLFFTLIIKPLGVLFVFNLFALTKEYTVSK